MAGTFRNKNDDSIDISELASLNEDISDDLLDQLQDKLAMEASSISSDSADDSTLFEEPSEPVAETPDAPIEDSAPEPVVEDSVTSEKTEEKKEEIQVNQSFDDNFIKKYKAKLNKKAQASLMNGNSVTGTVPAKYMQEQEENTEPIEEISNGNITEHPLSPEQKKYNESLDFLDGNVKYSKYVIYIDPKNVDFIDGLTVKERKNLINGILRQQDDIAITKQRFALIQTVIRQVIIAVLTISISIPVVYYTINTSLEATIDNHRRSQTNWQVLYKEHGKIRPN